MDIMDFLEFGAMAVLTIGWLLQAPWKPKNLLKRLGAKLNLTGRGPPTPFGPAVTGKYRGVNAQLEICTADNGVLSAGATTEANRGGSVAGGPASAWECRLVDMGSGDEGAWGRSRHPRRPSGPRQAGRRGRAGILPMTYFPCPSTRVSSVSFDGSSGDPAAPRRTPRHRRKR